MKNATEQYHKLLETILKDGKKKSDRTGTGTISIPDYHFKADMSEGFPLITTKRLHTKSIVHELLWFLKGDTNTKYLNENGVTIWDEWADENGDLGPVYGKQWVDWEYIPKLPDHKDERRKAKGFGGERLYSVRPINQIQNVIDTLKTNPESRRMIVSAWNVGELDQMALEPCHAFFQFYTSPLKPFERSEWVKKNNMVETVNEVEKEYDDIVDCLDALGVPKYRLSLQLYQRSADAFLGVPFNIASYSLLLMMMAQCVDMIPSEFIWTGGDCHLYDNHTEQTNEMLKRNPKKLPKVKLNPNIKDVFKFKFEDIELIGYDPHPTIKAPVAV
jgi:thymidylate synthase